PDKLQYSYRAFEATEFAKEQGKGKDYKTALFDALWVERKDIGLPITLLETAEKLGLNAATLEEALRQGTYAGHVKKLVERAWQAGITAAPTFILGRVAIIGWHYYDVFKMVMEKQEIQPKEKPPS
ncbi:MAG: DsbA family protein, partial [Chloroflexi bacterium]|nr:DsbA family protein [Chloroflexota bacterium]